MFQDWQHPMSGILVFQAWSDIYFDGIVVKDFTANDAAFASLIFVQDMPMSSINMKKYV